MKTATFLKASAVYALTVYSAVAVCGGGFLWESVSLDALTLIIALMEIGWLLMLIYLEVDAEESERVKRESNDGNGTY